MHIGLDLRGETCDRNLNLGACKTLPNYLFVRVYKTAFIPPISIYIPTYVLDPNTSHLLRDPSVIYYPHIFILLLLLLLSGSFSSSLHMLTLLSHHQQVSKQAKTLSSSHHPVSFLSRIAYTSFQSHLKSGSVLHPHLHHYYSTKITLSIFPPKTYILLALWLNSTSSPSPHLQGLQVSPDTVHHLTPSFWKHSLHLGWLLSWSLS